MSALSRVLKLVDVGSKRFLTNKVDRSVTGLIAQQQCVGPLHTPLANCGVVAQSHFGLGGIAFSIGEQPIKGLVNSGAQARMTVGEALQNLVFADISCLTDVKASGNWMWAAKLEVRTTRRRNALYALYTLYTLYTLYILYILYTLNTIHAIHTIHTIQGEGAKMWHTCEALRDVLLQLGPGIDGGKDSLSMAAKVNSGETVKGPGTYTLYILIYPLYPLYPYIPSIPLHTPSPPSHTLTHSLHRPLYTPIP